MKITVINNRPANGEKVPCVDSTSVAPGETHEMLGRTIEEVPIQMAFSDGNLVIVLAELDASDRAPAVNVMKNPADPGSGVVELAGCGFDILTQTGIAANIDPQMYIGAFDDAACTIPSVDAVMDTITTGTIDSGDGTNLLKVTPDSAGEVALKLTVTAPAVVYLKAWPVGSDYIVDSASLDTVTFIT